jgi:hypothetical protein
MTSAKPLTALAGFIFSAVILAAGYASFGLWPTLLFAFGFVGGWIAWILAPALSTWADIRLAFYVTLVLFVFHRIEERVSNFFPALQDITGVATPAILSPQVILLVLASVGGWLSIPFLMARGHAFGRYLAWTFFVSMGVTELAHFAFPLIVGGQYGYFPGMASVVALAPAAWWGAYLLARR